MKKVTLFATVVAASMLAGGVTAYTIGQVVGNDTRTYTPAAFGEQAGNHFTSYEADKYPDLTPKERENAFVKENGTTFLMKIGAPLKSGKPHDGRAPDYDDWDLNGDLLFWNEPLQCSYELSSMGIRVSPESMDRQLTMAGCDDRRTLPFHKAVLNGELPYTIGGGIGQSRLCMLLLGSAHIGEVQASVWDEATRAACAKAGIPLL